MTGHATADNTIVLYRLPAPGAIYRRAIGASIRRHPRSELPATTYASGDVSVDPDRLGAYNRICGFRQGDTLPPTYPHVLAFPLAMHLMSAPDFPFGVIGLVHVRNRIRAVRPVRVDERLWLGVHAEGVRDHPRGRQFDVVTTVTVDGVEVWREVSTYLRRSGPERGPTASRHESMVVAANAEWVVDRGIGQAYAAASGDRNPIHTSRVAARAAGFPRPIVHGMWSAARCVAALEGRLPDAYAVDVAFARPILLPSSIAFRTASADRSIAFSLFDPLSGAPHVTGEITPI